MKETHKTWAWALKNGGYTPSGGGYWPQNQALGVCGARIGPPGENRRWAVGNVCWTRGVGGVPLIVYRARGLLGQKANRWPMVCSFPLMLGSNMPQSEILIYQTKEGHTRIDVRIDNETLCLSLNQLAELFPRDKSLISST